MPNVREWWEHTRSAASLAGYRILPVCFRDGQLKPAVKWKDGQRCSLGQRIWYRDHILHDVLAFALDELILVDYDANKRDEQGNPLPIIPLAELELALGLPAGGLGIPFQVRESDGSAHWLFRGPALLDDDLYKHSADGCFPGVDIKRGRQLCWLKHGKKLARWRGFPLQGFIPKATPEMVAVFKKPASPVGPLSHLPPLQTVKGYDGTTTGGKWVLVDELRKMHRKTDRNAQLFASVKSIWSLVLGGEIDAREADATIKAGTLASGLAKDEPVKTRETIENGKKAAVARRLPARRFQPKGSR